MPKSKNKTKRNPIEQGTEISLDELPIEIKAYRDKNGFAVVFKSDEQRIGDSDGHLVDNFLVRILDGPVPKKDKAHAVALSDQHSRHVEVAEAKIDERGRLFVTSATDGIQRPAATQ
ncbi:MAG: hypothetical protein IKG11_02720 [Atopobiaceae bacterium]|nr:hypothetical protein [Atopobiaceae bacterium]